MTRQRVTSGAAWEKLVGYVRAVRVGDRILVSGTAPVAPDGGVHAPGDAYGQTRRCLDIIEAALVEAGGSLRDVVRTRMYVTNVELWPEVGRAHAEYFGSAPPVSSMVEVSRLIDPDMLVEVEAEAIVTAVEDNQAVDVSGEGRHVDPRENRVDYLELPASDIEAVKAFYGTAFGWRFTDYGTEYTSFTDGNTTGGFYAKPGNAPAGPLVVIYASDLESAQARVVAAGAKVTRPVFSFPGGRRFHFQDPGGNELAVWSDGS